MPTYSDAERRQTLYTTHWEKQTCICFNLFEYIITLQRTAIFVTACHTYHGCTLLHIKKIANRK